jgi:uncharacterized membrane protein
METVVRRHRLLLMVVAMLGLAVLAGGVALWPRGEVAQPAAAGQEDPTRIVAATLTRLSEVPCEQPDPAAPRSTCVEVEAELADGRRVSFETTDPTGDTFRVGQRVKLAELEQEGQATLYTIRDLERTRPMLVLVALFVLAVVAFGGWQGARSLLGLAASFAVIIGFIVPAILHGHSPVAVALVGAMAIMLASLYLAHGVGRKTTSAVVGTALALGLTAALTAGFVTATSLTGLATDEAQNVSFQVGGISLRGLLLAAIIIGGLGVLDDVTVSQASLVFELRRADPAASFGALVRSALVVGRDHISATVNTLFLAYAGASLPLLVLFTTGGAGFGEVTTAEVAAVEVVRTLCGSIGLVAAVPLTTVLAAALASPEAETAAGHPAHHGTAAPPGPSPARVPYSPGRGLTPDETMRLYEQVLALHQPSLAQAAVATGGFPPPEELPADARAAVLELKRLAPSTRQNGGSWYRRALSAGTASLDLRDRGHLDLLVRCGPFSTDARVWVDDDPVPVIESRETLDGAPRVTYRLDPSELDHLRVALDRAGLADATLVPRRTRTRVGH